MRRLSLNAIGKTGIARVAQPFFGGLGAVLMFHHVGHRTPNYFGSNDHLSIKPEFLRLILEEFRQECIDIVSLDEAIRRINAPQTTQPFVTLTFDDGYRDNIETAYPILQTYRVPFTLFVCSGFVDRNIPIWWLSLEHIIQANNVIELEVNGRRYRMDCVGKHEKRRAFEKALALLASCSNDELFKSINILCAETSHDPYILVDREMSSWHMLRELSNDPLVTIGAHTVSHPFLPKLADDLALDEMTGSRDRIEKMIGVRPEFIAYPYGYKSAVGEREVALAEKAGFKAGVTTRKGLITEEHANHPWSLPRVSINGHFQSMSAMRALLSGLPFYFANGCSRVKTL